MKTKDFLSSKGFKTLREDVNIISPEHAPTSLVESFALDAPVYVNPDRCIWVVFDARTDRARILRQSQNGDVSKNGTVADLQKFLSPDHPPSQ